MHAFLGRQAATFLTSKSTPRLDAVYRHTKVGPVFVEVPPPTDRDLQVVPYRIVGRILKMLKRRDLAIVLGRFLIVMVNVVVDHFGSSWEIVPRNPKLLYARQDT
jgi:hypothetical protein